MNTDAPSPRDTISPSALQDEIRSCLRTANAGGGTASRETFAAIAEQVVQHLEERGYRVSAPSPLPPKPDQAGQ